MLQPYQHYFSFKELNEGVGEGKPDESKSGGKQEKEPNFHAFGGKGYSLGGEDAKKPPTLSADPDNPEVAEAIEMSKVIYLSELASQLPPEPEEKTPDAITLSLRLPTGKTVRRKFLKTSPLIAVEIFCKIELNQVEDLKLISTYPRKTFTDMKVLIGSAFDSDSTVIVEKA